MIGKTITDELAYSLNGDNIHYGTPRNSKAPDRVPGGSSSGSAAAVAASLCDFALGTDTGGSVRIPGSFCGLFGIRTSHGTVSTAGLVPLMPSFDTVGWFAREPGLFQQVGEVLLPEVAPSSLPTRLLIVSEGLELLDNEARLVFRNAVDALGDCFGEVATISIAGAAGLAPWRDVFRIASAHETWRVHGAWISAHGELLERADSRAICVCQIHHRRRCSGCTAQVRGTRQKRPRMRRDQYSAVHSHCPRTGAEARCKRSGS